MNSVLFKNHEVELANDLVKVGELAPSFKATKGDLTTYEFKPGKTTLISVVPSLDTGVCELQTIRFNSEASNLENADVLTISEDLPFAQGRFCTNKHTDKILVLSDYNGHDFGLKYGLLMNEYQLLARAVLIIDKTGKLVYQQLVKDVHDHPDYDTALKVVKSLG